MSTPQLHGFLTKVLLEGDEYYWKSNTHMCYPCFNECLNIAERLTRDYYGHAEMDELDEVHAALRPLARLRIDELCQCKNLTR